MYRLPNTSGVIMERDEIVASRSVDPRVCPSKRDACASRYAFTL